MEKYDDNATYVMRENAHIVVICKWGHLFKKNIKKWPLLKKSDVKLQHLEAILQIGAI
jgi:hypothetical protein